jgi:hypothetical protein
MVPSVLLSSVNRETAEEDECCHVIKLEAFPVFDNTELSWRFSATMSSPYKQETGWDKYFDAFEIRTSLDGGEVLTTRILAHPHPTDQPFTRSTNDTVSLPKGVTIVVAVARDSVSGFCGSGVSLELPTTDDPEALTESASSVANTRTHRCQLCPPSSQKASAGDSVPSTPAASIANHNFHRQVIGNITDHLTFQQ